jgi:hypothetical protein
MKSDHTCYRHQSHKQTTDSKTQKKKRNLKKDNNRLQNTQIFYATLNPLGGGEGKVSNYVIWGK